MFQWVAMTYNGIIATLPAIALGDKLRWNLSDEPGDVSPTKHKFH